MQVFWLEQSEANVPCADDWLADRETTRLSSFRIVKRRGDWRLGRWTAKCAVAATLQLELDPLSLRRIEISAAETGQPEVIQSDRRQPVTISISHRAGGAICAVAHGDVKLGCDLEVIEPRSDAFIADYFTAAEQASLNSASEQDRPLLATLFWGAKESALKAMHVGLRADTRTVEVRLFDLERQQSGTAETAAMQSVHPNERPRFPQNSWLPLQILSNDGTDFPGWWRYSGNQVRTIVSAPPPGLPIELRIPAPTGNSISPQS